MLLACTPLLHANDSIPPADTIHRPLIIEQMADRVAVLQDSAIDRLLNDKIQGTRRELVQVQGYRVQVYSSNRQQTAKTEAFDIEKMVQDIGLGVETYVVYNPPFWKVRVGNFRTQEEAQQLKEEIVRALPQLQGDTYIVRDQVQLIQ